MLSACEARLHVLVQLTDPNCLHTLFLEWCVLKIAVHGTLKIPTDLVECNLCNFIWMCMTQSQMGLADT